MPPRKRAYGTTPTTVRLSKELSDRLDAACRDRPGMVSKNTWITEAISEKLDRELAAKGTSSKIKGGRN